MRKSKTFKSNRELDVTTADDILNLELGKLCLKAKLLNDTSILASSKPREFLTLGTSDDHLATGKDKGRCLGLADSHDHGRKTLRIIFSITGVQGDRFQIKPALQIYCGYNIPRKKPI